MEQEENRQKEEREQRLENLGKAEMVLIIMVEEVVVDCMVAGVDDITVQVMLCGSLSCKAGGGGGSGYVGAVLDGSTTIGGNNGNGYASFTLVE